MSWSYLQNLNVGERDDLLASIVYVDKPMHFLGVGYDQIELLSGDNKNILNYSQIFAYLGNRIKLPSVLGGCLPSPESLRTGDSIRFGDNRGLGTYYIFWLKKDIVTLNETFLEAFKTSYEELEGDSIEPSVCNSDGYRSKKAKLNSEETTFLKFASREVDGPHNDGLHDCYLLTHYDEYGYAPSAAFASLPVDYFSNLEVETMLFDPLLCHSKSRFMVIAQNNDADWWAEITNFPLEYFGYFDENSDNELIWVHHRNEDYVVDIPMNYVPQLRTLFNNHFKPADSM